MELLSGYSNQTHVRDRLTEVIDLPRSRSKSETKPTHKRILRLSSDEELKLIEKYQEGFSVYELARRFPVTRQTASNILERHGVRRRYKLLSAEDLVTAKRLYESGASYATIGAFFDVSPSTVRKAFLGAGGESRPSGTNQWSS